MPTVEETIESIVTAATRDQPVARIRLIAQHHGTLVFRTIMGLTKEEFAHSTKLAAAPVGLPPLSSGKVGGMGRSGTATRPDQARVAAETLSQVIAGTLFGDPPGDLKSKQDEPDTERGWPTVQGLAAHGVPYVMLGDDQRRHGKRQSAAL